jgi:L-2-hydroxyglutarate oxidase LhgO
MTRRGNQLLTEYCRDREIPINQCGKLVVTRNEQDCSVLEELLRRGRRNGVPLQEVSEQEAREIEPRVRTFQRAIFSPTTASVDPENVMQAMEADARAEGIDIHNGVRFLRKRNGAIYTTNGQYQAGYVINAAGLYADAIAREYGYSETYRILPFKGLYLYSSEPAGSLRTNVYPVPDIDKPFLGVHFTVTVNGHTKIGPTAIPAFWREQYNGYSNFKLDEFVETAWREMNLFVFSGFDFKKLAMEELRKYSRRHMVELASQLLQGIDVHDYQKWGRPGIRAQLVDTRHNTLEMDFVIQGDDRSMHVLNAVSPAFTCALPFAEYVVDEIRTRMQ